MCKHRLSFLTLILKHSSLVQALFKSKPCFFVSHISHAPATVLQHLPRAVPGQPWSEQLSEQISTALAQNEAPFYDGIMAWYGRFFRVNKDQKSQLRLSILSNSIHIRTSDCGLPWLPFPYLFPYLSFFCLIFFHFFWPCGQVFDPEGLPGCHLRRVWFGILSRLLSKCLNENHEELVEPKQMKLCQAWWTLMNAEILMNMEAKEI